MNPTNPKNRTALILSLGALAMAPQGGMAQGVDRDALALFTPEVAACLDTGAPAQCDPFLVPMMTCADDMAAPVCAQLLADPAATLDDPAATARAQEVLLAFAETDMAEVAPVEPAATPEPVEPEVAEEVAPAEPEPAEPPAEPDVVEEAPAEPEVTADAPEPEVSEPAAPAEVVDEAPAEDAPGESGQAAEAPVSDPAPAEQPAEAADPATDTATDDPASASDTVTDEPTQAETAADETVADDTVAETPAPADGADEAAEINRLLREAEAAAATEVEPEVVEEAISEAEAPPAEAPAPALNARERALVEEISRRPEVATALGILGAALGRDLATEATDDADPAERAEPAEVVEDEITATDTRRSTEDFDSGLTLRPDAAAAAPAEGQGRRRDLERAGLGALGALAIGMLINENRVVARGDERVIVQGNDGDLQIWRDDDAILRSDGGTRRIERYADGTTVSEWRREDGSRVVTVRDATGRVLSRQRVLADGVTVPLFDDATRVEPIDVSVLPEMRYRELRLGAGTDPDRALALLERAEADARAVDRSFSLRQIREVRQVRELVPVLSPDPITFETNRASIRAEEVPKLLQVGRLIERLIQRNPSEVILIEGHTDASGSAAYNLGLSDRRAESVALALTEFFRIPPENLIVQGYGESYLRVQTQASEERNRRVVMRRITPLLPQ